MKTRRFRSGLFLMICFGIAVEARPQSAPAPPPAGCSYVDLSANKAGAGNAVALVAKLASISDLKAQAMTDSAILLCGPKDELPEVVNALKNLAGPKPAADHAQPPNEQHSLRLYYLRDAKDVATAMNGVFSGINVQAIGSDQLVFQTSKPADEANIKILRRWIAVLDTPRPEVSMHVWNMQLSSHDNKALSLRAEEVKNTVDMFNQRIQEALERGWRLLNDIRPTTNPASFFSAEFTAYVDEGFAKAQKPGEYSLKYGAAFNPLRQDLSSMLGFISSTSTPLETARRFVNRLENRDNNAADPGSNLAECETADANAGGDNPAFSCLRAQFGISLEAAHLAFLRRAMANFLFEYKMSVEYPDDFGEYDFSHSAQTLDAQLDPLFVAFNRDTAAYLRRVEKTVLKNGEKDRDITFSSAGIVDVRTLSGVQTSAGATSESSFATTPPALLQDFARQLKAAEASGGTSSLLTDNLSGHGATALMAFLNSGQSAKVSLSRATTLTVTPHSLPGAGAAELDVQFEVKDASPPSIADAPTGAPTETTDRFSDQTFNTTVRVDSLRLFPASSFAAQLSRARRPIGLLPPFVELPYIGSFIKLKRSPDTVYHQTVAVVSATVVPTAADILNGLRFSSDSKGDPDLEQLKLRHTWVLNKIACEANPKESDCPAPSSPPERSADK